MTAIDTAILLAAGEGSRLRSVAPFKPLCRVAGRALVDHAIDGLSAAGIARVVVVTGYGADDVEAHLASADHRVSIEVVRTSDWHLPNGVSALAAAGHVGNAGALLVMCDHLVHPDLYAWVGGAGWGAGLRLGIDRRIGHRWVDPEDVTCVRTRGDAIVAIGKGLEPHDAYDTGVFAVGPPFFAALATLPAPSITEGVRLLVDTRSAQVVDCTGLNWLDVDDPAALAFAQAATVDGAFGRRG